MKGTDILKTAREQIKNFIVFEVKNLYILTNMRNPNFSEDEEYVLDVNFPINVEVDNSYLDVDGTTIEVWNVDEIHVTLDDNIFFKCSENDSEIEWNKISTDELAGIANILENQYLKIVKK